ncbi:MAG: glycosyl hydrolase family 28-related protein [Flavobacterium sp.]|uniref:glycosyl hydrolase family 28-related protein n=1 Tax=Flavobacterium sp. TaxID=239 RepID=UPI0032649D71
MDYVERLGKIEDLRNYVFPSPSYHVHIYVECHSITFDDGGGFFYYYDSPDFASRFPDNDGTIIKHNTHGTDDDDMTGRWIRVIDGYININYFGCKSVGTDISVKIQSAIDHAYSSHLLSGDFPLQGNTVYFPDGTYFVKKTLILKSGVSLVGGSLENTFLIRSNETSSADGFMLEMDKGRIEGCNITDITFNGNKVVNAENFPVVIDGTNGCFKFIAQKGDYDDGGLWSCTFKNLRIRNFNGNGIELIASGDEDYNLPNQLLVFENVTVVRQKEDAYALLMKGEHGQITFINCGFGGIKYDFERVEGIDTWDMIKKTNVSLQGITKKIGLGPNVVSFINSTFQDSECGIVIEYSESITMDTCWFENLDLAITVLNDGNDKSKGINILNNRFANAAGFGSLPIRNQHIENPPFDYVGRAITSRNSQINVYNNYVTVSNMDSAEPYSPLKKRFILGLKPNDGIRTSGNSFYDSRLGYSYGIMQFIGIQADNEPQPSPWGHCLDLKDNKIIFVDGGDYTNNEVSRLISSVSAGETISIRAFSEKVIFNNEKNIFFSNQPKLRLDKGDIATFIKIDNYFINGGIVYLENYQLIFVFKSTSPS